MAWVKVDDQFFVNRKSRKVGLEGRALFLASVCYCAMQENDGVFTEADLPVIAAMAEVPQAVGDRLIDTGLWHRREEGIEVHQYLQHNPSREQVAARKSRAEKAAAARYQNTATSTATSNPDGMPLPSPSPSPDTSSSSSSTSDQVPDTVWTELARKRLAIAKDVKNVPAWTKKVIANDRAELGERATWLWNTYQISPSHLADVLLSGGTAGTLTALPKRQVA